MPQRIKKALVRRDGMSYVTVLHSKSDKKECLQIPA